MIQWGGKWPPWFPGGRTDYSGATHQNVVNAEARTRFSRSRGSAVGVGSGSGSKDIREGGRHVVIDLSKGVASIFVTKYVPRYNTKVVSRFTTKFRKVITALTVNYTLNGKVVTQVVIPTRIVMQEKTSGSHQGTSNSVTTPRRRTVIKPVPGKNIPAKLIV